MTGDLSIPGLTDLALIGQGGFGEVYRGRQPAFNRDVAVKVLSQAVDETTRRRFERECKALGSLAGHPNIVALYDAGATMGRPYMVMQYVAAGSLAAELVHSGPIAPPDAVRIAIRTLGALHTAHAAGILHRDIKPANILRSSLGEPLLADFGIAQLDGGTTSTVSVSATIAHASPEVLSGETSTVQSDIYSLGSTLFALLTGHPPFVGAEGQSAGGLIGRVFNAPVPDLRGSLPAVLCDVLEQLLAKDPSMRFASALAAGRALQHVEASCGSSITELPVPPGAQPVLTVANHAAGAGRAGQPSDRTVTGPTPYLTPSGSVGISHSGPGHIGLGGYPSGAGSGAEQASANLPTLGPSAGIVWANTVAGQALPPQSGGPAHYLQGPSGPVQVAPPPPPVPPPAPRSSRALPVAITAVAAVVILIGGLVLLSNRSQSAGSGEPTTSASDQTSQPSQPTVETATVTAPAAPAAPAAGSVPRAVRVNGTCGADGHGDCYLTVRSGPSGKTASLRRLDEGAELVVVCQVHGTSATATAFGTSSDIWSKLEGGGYVATIYLDGVDKYTVTTPC